MAKLLIPIVLITLCLIALAFAVSRWRTSSTVATTLLKALCIGCVAAGLLALWFFYP